MKHYSFEFIQECERGGKQAQKKLFETLYAPMFRVCLRYVNQNADAEDCLMRGFLKMFQNLSTFRFEGEHSLFVWVRRIMVNEALMFLRKKHNFLISIDSEVEDIAIPNEIIQQIEAEDLIRKISSLPTGYRTVFNLFVIEGYLHQEIAEMLGISENTSRTQLSKARIKLKKMLEEVKEVQNASR